MTLVYKASPCFFTFDQNFLGFYCISPDYSRFTMYKLTLYYYKVNTSILG